VNHQVDLLSSNLVELLNLVPRKTKTVNDLAFKSFLENKTDANWRIFCRYRNRFKNCLRKIKRQKYCKIFEGKTTKQIWNVLRENGVQETNTDLRNLNCDNLNELNRHFLSHQDSASNNATVPSFPNRFNGFAFRNISVSELYCHIMSIKSNSVGCDLIPIKFVKLLFPYICDVLVFVVNSILTTSVFPDAWKIARVVPIKKKGSSTAFDNLRPISVLPALSKVVESIMKQQIMEYVDERALLNDRQSAYRSGHNTTSLLVSMTDLIRKNTFRTSFSVLLSLDLTKAFDSIQNLLLNNKLSTRYNFSASACMLVKSYLDNRSQFVQCSDSRSECLDVVCGVPQGSVLGPILFMLFINDFFECLDENSCQIFMFADDIQILFFGQTHSLPETELLINDCLSRIESWMSENKLKINANKTKAMLFNSLGVLDLQLHLSLNNTQIEFVDKLKCLGVTIDNRLTFESHIHALSSSINFTLKRLYSLNVHLPLNVRKSVATSLLVSRLMYGIEVYSGTIDRHVAEIRRLFNRVVRFVFNIKLHESVSNAVIDFLNLSVDNFIISRLLLLFYNALYLDSPQYLVGLFEFGRSTRSPQLVVPRINSCLFERSFQIRVIRCWNFLPNELKQFSSSTATFKRKLTLYLNN